MSNDQLPEGYKQTEVGVIPEDWKVEELANLITAGPKNGYSGRAGESAKGTPTLRLTATSSGYLIINDETVKYLDETIGPNSDLFLKPGDVLIQRSNTYELVGTTAIFKGLPKTYVYPDLMMRLRFNDQLTAHWFWKYANSTRGRRFFLSTAAGSTGSMPKISGAKLREMPIPLPPLPEKRSIATTLSDVDALIASLDKLIAKKRAIKTATMQQLLTGKKRLPGFGEGKGYEKTEIGMIPEDWTVTKIGEDALTYSGGTPTTSNSEYYSGDISWITSGDLNRQYISEVDRKISEKGLKNSSAKLIPANTLLIALYGATAGVSAISEIEAAINQAVLAIIPKKLNKNYLFYVLQLRKEQIIETYTQGGQPNLSGEIIRSLSIAAPQLEEQRSIATVLSDMDAEITALEARRAKTQSIKQGMMQELLTGRTRLV